MTNYTLKSAASVSNALGSVVVSYSICHALLSLAGFHNLLPLQSIFRLDSRLSISHPDDNERLPEEAKSCISGALTGLLFKSTSGAVKCLKVWHTSYFIGRTFENFFFPGRCGGPWTCLPLGFWPEKARNRAALHIIAWILPSSSSLSMSTSSNHNHVCCSHDHGLCHGHDYTDVKFNINQPT